MPLLANFPDGKVRVNWIRDGMAGITYIDGQARGTSQVVTEESLKPYLEAPPPPTTHQQELHSMSIDELKAKLAELRQRRLPQPKIKQLQHKPSSTSTGASAKPNVKDLLMTLRPEERKLLAQLLERKEGQQ